ncbi:SET and MYND domain-containing protein 4 isoform X2 [Hemibagrus wyckioides]|uniref:SET and MYND domain-containing protein 4 isoform X2 n=1 Tax=Hemibagrus wyckioides TaxID=337641 RepID=UPI00266D0761|nr:SET and MYND domain-containing protein 4 isoform X2 [Hemibagrus wyckioides]
MDLPCPEWTKHVEQKWTSLESATRERFSLLTDIDDIFHFGQSQLQPEDLETLSRISEKYPVKKSSECAARLREQGNVNFKERDYKSAALCYTQGVCHAEKNTEQLSLCYANRSAALFHLGHYTKCLEDIQRAFDEGYPCQLQTKLVDRRIQCTSLVKKQEYMKASPFKHQTPQTKENKGGNTSVSSAVSVHFTTEKERHLVVTENKSAGEVVVEDEAFSFVLIPVNGQYNKSGKANIFTTGPQHCHHCLCENINTVPCRGCSYAQYCGQRCEKEAWHQYHCWECSVGSELLTLGVFAHLALRVALKAGINEVQRARESCFNLVYEVPKATFVSSNRSGNGKLCSSGETSESLGLVSDLNVNALKCSQSSEHSSCYHGKSYLGIYSLLPHVGKHDPNLRFLLAFTIAALFQRLPLEVPPCHDQEEWSMCWGSKKSLLGSTALRHMMQLRCNAQAVTTIKVKEDTSLPVQSSEEFRIATAIFPVLSLLNHSCQPNTSISFDVGLSSSGSSNPLYFSSGVTVTVRACRDISAGQELLHCYGPHCSRMEVEKRQHLLLKQYFFHCKCEACRLELADRSRRLPLTFNGLKCEKCGSLLKMSVDVHECSQLSCDHHILNTDLQRRMQILQNHLDQALELMENHQINGALCILQKASNQADSILMKTHPLQGELADAMARAYATMGLWQQAASHLKSSIAAICSKYGKDSLELGRQQFKLAQLHFNGGDGPSALSVIPLARHILSLHCDPLCWELQELQAMEACLCDTM